MANVSAGVSLRAWERGWPAAGSSWAIAAVLIGAGTTVMAAAANGHGPVSVVAIGVWGAGLALIGVIDVRTRTVPNRLVYPALALALVVAAVDPARSLVGSLVATAFAGGLFAVAFYVRPRALFRGASAVPPPRRGSTLDVRWAGAAGTVAVLVVALAQPESSAASAFAAAAVAGCPFLPYFVSEGWAVRAGTAPTNGARGAGGGDVKLAALLGAVAGAPDVLSVLPVAVLAGAVAALTLALVRRGGGAIPYGPFLAAATVLAVL